MKSILIIFILSLSMSAFAQDNAILKSEFTFNEAPFKECHASSIESTPEGLIATWFGGTKEKNKDVEIWVSRNVDDI